MEKYLQISFLIFVPLIAVGFAGYAFAQGTNTTTTDNAESYVNSIWGLFLAAAAIFGTISAIAIKIATNVKNRLADNTDENSKKIVSIIDDFILPIFKTGNEFVEKTKTQEEKIKELAEITYDFMGSKADEIKDKTQVKIEKLTTDVNAANVQAIEYKKKLERAMQLLDELKGNPTTPVPETQAAKSPL